MSKFSSATGVPRPVRLSRKTRDWCAEMLSGAYGKELLKTQNITVDDVENFESLSAYDKIDICIDRIAKESRIIIREGELLCGSATLYASAWAVVPVKYKNDWVTIGTNHTTYNFAKVLEVGIDAYVDEINESLARGSDEIGTKLLKSMLNTIASLRIWHKRYMDEIEKRIDTAKDSKTRKYYKDLADNLRDMPFKRPQSFRQAMQSLWFIFIFTRLTGNFSGLGKIDRMLEPFYNRELEAGTLDEKEVRELMAHFFIKGCEWTTLDKTAAGGDGMFFQNIVLAGIDKDGNETAGNVTRLILETVEELPIGDYPIAVRLNSSSPEWLVRKCAEVSRHGVGVVAVYNEEVIIKALQNEGIPYEDAVNFSNDGCWEILIQGKTTFGYYPMDVFTNLQINALELDKKDSPNPVYETYDQLYAKVIEGMHAQLDEFNRLHDGWCVRVPEPSYVSPVASLLTDGCIEKATDYLAKGSKYAIGCPHYGGFADLANDLYVIKKMVYEQGFITLDQLITILKNDWLDHEELMKYMRVAHRYYGNDNDEVDEIMSGLVSEFIDYTHKTLDRCGVRRHPGISTFGRQVSEWREHRYATASGRKKGDILSGNICPAPMTDYEGPTAIIKSCCKMPLDRLAGGTALDINLEPATIRGEAGVESIMALYRGFVLLGGCFLHLNVADPSELEDAVLHPENHQNLTVRVSGWSSRFITIEKSWQQMLIERAKSGLSQ